MEIKRTYLIAGLAAGVLAIGAAGAIAHRAGHGEHGKGFRHNGGPGGAMGFGALGFGGPPMRFCRADGAEIADHLIVRIEHRVKPTDAQKAVFEEFKTATRTAADKMKAGCPAGAQTADKETFAKMSAVERLAMAQTGLEASLEAMKAFRPAAEKLYASLDEAQKKKLDQGNRSWRWNDRGRGKPDKPGDPNRGGPDDGGTDSPNKGPDDRG